MPEPGTDRKRNLRTGYPLPTEQLQRRFGRFRLTTALAQRTGMIVDLRHTWSPAEGAGPMRAALADLVGGRARVLAPPEEEEHKAEAEKKSKAAPDTARAGARSERRRAAA